MTARKRIWHFGESDDPHVDWQRITDVDDPTFEAVSVRLEAQPDPPVDLWRALGRLTEKQRFVIDLRYGLNGKGEHSEQEISVLMGISQQAVSRISERAMESLLRVVSDAPVG